MKSKTFQARVDVHISESFPLSCEVQAQRATVQNSDGRRIWHDTTCWLSAASRYKGRSSLPRPQGGMWTVDSVSVSAGRSAVASRRAIGRVQSRSSWRVPAPGSRGERCRQVPLASPPRPLQALSCRARARPRPTSHAAAPPPRVQVDDIPAVLLSNDNVPASHSKLDVTTVSGRSLQRVAAILTARCPAKPPTDTETTGWGSSGWWASSR